jgi:chorismate mutase
MDIEKIREKIDAIDKEILDLLKERFSFMPEIAKYKQGEEIEIEDKTQEGKVISRALVRAGVRGLDSSFVRGLFEDIIKESKRLQKKHFTK